jgi:hypothetical protein
MRCGELVVVTARWSGRSRLPAETAPAWCAKTGSQREALGERVVDAQLVVSGNALGDADDQPDPGVLGFEDRVGRKARRHEHHRRVGACLVDRLVEGVEDRNPIDVLADASP